MYRRAQAAMEFLMTYGWAILVVLAAVAALAAFGVLSLDKILPESCKGPSDMPCLEKASLDGTAGTISFALRNGVGSKITLTAVNGTGVEPDSDCLLTDSHIQASEVEVEGGYYSIHNSTADGINASVADGIRMVFTLNCTEDVSDMGRLSQDFHVHYRTQNGLDQKALVTIKAKP